MPQRSTVDGVPSTHEHMDGLLSISRRNKSKEVKKTENVKRRDLHVRVVSVHTIHHGR